MQFEWDQTKSDRNRRERGFGFDYAALIFAGRVAEWEDDREDYGETRVRAVGRAGDDLLHVVYTDRGQTRRIISARLASKKERTLWLAAV